MRPSVGVPLILLFLIGVAIAIYVKCFRNQKEARASLQNYRASLRDSHTVTPPAVVGSIYTGPIDEILATKFLAALSAEYVHGQPQAVGGFLDGAGPAVTDAVQPYEDRVCNSGDPGATIRDIRREWGLRDSE
eukprot:TRINITY_DN101169_c0_g1_i1.p1 TRINITY_DN101169_c0_g1~~TRINITY_DN101169_c0_g1_i1.p1  ORF type:complete len:133 (+),score=14.07 TRINITY_DN101169_c0_g1_i1:2-400(+)